MLAEAISPENGQKWLTCLAVTSQAEDMAYILKHLTYDMNCGGVYTVIIMLGRLGVKVILRLGCLVIIYSLN